MYRCSVGKNYLQMTDNRFAEINIKNHLGSSQVNAGVELEEVDKEK